jgi:hypothetical protein
MLRIAGSNSVETHPEIFNDGVHFDVGFVVTEGVLQLRKPKLARPRREHGSQIPGIGVPSTKVYILGRQWHRYLKDVSFLTGCVAI